MKYFVLVFTLVVGSAHAARFTADPQPNTHYKGIKGPYLGDYLVWDSKRGGYGLPSKSRTYNPKVRGLTDEELQLELGIDPIGGDVSNPETVDFDLELGTWVGFLFKVEDIKVGPYLKLYRFNEQFKWTLDAGESYLGTSLRYDFTALLRPSLGVGVGTLFDGEWYGNIALAFRVW